MSRQNNRFAGSAKTRKNLSNVDRNLRKAMKVVDSGPRMSLAEGKSGTNIFRSGDSSEWQLLWLYYERAAVVAQR